MSSCIYQRGQLIVTDHGVADYTLQRPGSVCSSIKSDESRVAGGTFSRRSREASSESSKQRKKKIHPALRQKSSLRQVKVVLRRLRLCLMSSTDPMSVHSQDDVDLQASVRPPQCPVSNQWRQRTTLQNLSWDIWIFIHVKR